MFSYESRITIARDRERASRPAFSMTWTGLDTDPTFFQPTRTVLAGATVGKAIAIMFIGKPSIVCASRASSTAVSALDASLDRPPRQGRHVQRSRSCVIQ